jgi:hypothetical protein
VLGESAKHSPRACAIASVNTGRSGTFAVVRRLRVDIVSTEVRSCLSRAAARPGGAPFLGGGPFPDWREWPLIRVAIFIKKFGGSKRWFIYKASAV